MKALADPVRLRLLQVLHDRGETCVCELLPAVGATQSNVSMHLRVLRAAGLVAGQKIGKWVFYRLEQAAVDDLVGWLAATFEAATAAEARPTESLFACCQSGAAPRSLAEARARLQADCAPQRG